MKRFVFGLVVAALMLFGPGLRADDSSKANAAGTVITVSGKVTLYSDSSDGAPLTIGKAVFAGDRIKTGSNGRAMLVLSDGTQLKLNYLTDITLRDKDIQGKASPRGIALIKIALGDLWARVTKKDSKLEFETPSAVAAVKGTNPVLTVLPDGNTCVSLIEGSMMMNSGGCSQGIKGNQQICIAPGQKACDATVTPLSNPGTWFTEINSASTAVVTLNVKDAAGNMHNIQVQYSK
jgi:hypothetical protein